MARSILSAGHNVNGRTIAGQPVNDLPADMRVNATVTSDLRARASQTAQVFGGTYSGDVTLEGRGAANVAAAQVFSSAGNVLIGGNLTVRGDNIATFSGASAQGRDVTVQAFGGNTLRVDGNVIMSSNAQSGIGGGAGTRSGNATGGVLRLFSTDANSLLDIRGNVNLSATATAGMTFSGANSGDSQGGSIVLTAQRGGRTTIAGSLAADARGSTLGTQGGAGTTNTAGGQFTLFTFDAGSSISVAQNVVADSSAVGAATAVGASADTVGGQARGGSAQIGSGIINIGGALTLNTDAIGGSAAANGGQGGRADGGSASVRGDSLTVTAGTPGAQVVVAGQVAMTANATGGASGVNAAGAAGVGGRAQVIATQGSQLQLNGQTLLQATGTGSAGGTLGGAGTGGTAEVQATGTGSSVTIQAASIASTGFGGASPGGTGGQGMGGVARILAQSEGQVSIAQQSNLGSGGAIANGVLGASGQGGATQSGIAGVGRGGTLSVRAETGGDISLTAATTIYGGTRAWARGFGGAATAEGGRGGLGQGGTIQFGATGAGSTLVASGLSLSANGFGSFAAPAGTVNFTGGDARGGTNTVFANDSGVVTIGASFARASGLGGLGGGTGDGGDGFGGTMNVDILGGRLEIRGSQQFGALSFGAGGGGGDGAIGGDASGGAVNVRVANGGAIVGTDTSTDPLAVNLQIFSQSSGGAGTVQGGTGSAGTARVTGQGGTIDLAAAQIVSNGIGGARLSGSGGTGGSGFGGTAAIDLTNSADRFTIGRLELTAPGFGGSVSGPATGAGGNGTGGQATIRPNAGQINVTNALTMGADGTGGTGVGGAGGTGTGGLASVFSTASTATFASAIVTANGGGGAGSAGGAGQGGRAELISSGNAVVTLTAPLSLRRRGSAVPAARVTAEQAGAALLRHSPRGAACSSVRSRRTQAGLAALARPGLAAPAGVASQSCSRETATPLSVRPRSRPTAPAAQARWAGKGAAGPMTRTQPSRKAAPTFQPVARSWLARP
jgi:hypothetical protein